MQTQMKQAHRTAAIIRQFFATGDMQSKDWTYTRRFVDEASLKILYYRNAPDVLGLRLLWIAAFEHVIVAVDTLMRKHVEGVRASASTIACDTSGAFHEQSVRDFVARARVIKNMFALYIRYISNPGRDWYETTQLWFLDNALVRIFWNHTMGPEETPGYAKCSISDIDLRGRWCDLVVPAPHL